MTPLTSTRHLWFFAILCAADLMEFAALGGGQGEAIAQALNCPSCQDYNGCTADSCDETTGTCRHDPLDCDDGNPCTSDSSRCYGDPFLPLGCVHFNLASGTACNDGDACTGADACDGSGHCAGSAQPVGTACDDGNVCTSGEVCDAFGACAGPPLTGTECDDRNACTRGERCAAAPDGTVECRAGTTLSCDDGLLCTDDSCDPISGDCIHAPRTCDDGNPCTDDACDPATGACDRTLRQAGACDDANICTQGEACSNGNCVGGTPWNCGATPQCGSFQCEPFEHRCIFRTFGGGSCPAPGQCYFYDCFNGSCRRNDILSGACDDGNPCTLEQCIRGACTVQFNRNGAACDDGTACTQNDVCVFTQCRGTPSCGDGDACTQDLCDPATGTCLGTQPENCDDGNPCTTDACSPAGGCSHVLNSNPCDDGNACTNGDVCTNGSCRGTLAVTCHNDNNICTDDECDPATGRCVHRDNLASCDDSNPCTVFDSCTDGSCHPGQPKFCDDFKVCTQDSCDPATGACLNQPASGPCSDGSFCTVGDTCDQGVCRPGTAPNCDDGNACTTDGCSASSGCFHTVLTGACDDGNPCTTGDRCLNGACKPTDPVGCVDGNLCTVDFCDRASGACVHEASSADCSDGNACTIDLCDTATGTCTGQEPLDCDDASDCTHDTCDPASGCHHEADLTLCPQNVVDIALSFTSDTGKGSGTLIWSTTYEWSIGGFNVVAFNQQGVATRLNTDPIPCTACNTGAGVAYEFILGKHKSGRDLFVELLGSDGSVLGTFGPASKMAR